MDALEQMNLAMDYIEEHLEDEIDTGRAARLACCSEYHFRRMFSSLSGHSLGEYIRLRRLTKAAQALRRGNARIIDVALRYGYDSPDSFARAFAGFHGVTPAQARKNGVPVKAVLPMTFQLTVKGGSKMNYRIEQKDAFQIVGVKKRISMVFEGMNPQMDSLWQSLTGEDIGTLKALCDMEPRGMLCVSANFEERTAEGSRFDQYIGVATTQSAASGRFETLSVAASAWAVFTATGAFPGALQQTWAKIYAEWFPTSGYELTGGPEMLWNEGPDTTKADYRSEIWIPVARKSG